jgi:hypothetical protein
MSPAALSFHPMKDGVLTWFVLAAMQPDESNILRCGCCGEDGKQHPEEARFQTGNVQFPNRRVHFLNTSSGHQFPIVKS